MTTEAVPRCRLAVDAFMECMAGKYELVHKDYSVVLTKTG